jgi:endo-beta-N-acetylglucosaminidase D
MELNRRTFFRITSAAGGAVVLSPALAAAARPVPAAGSAIAPKFPGVAADHPGLDVFTAEAIDVLLAYDPTTDPDARFFRSHVPVAARIAPFAATQALPELSSNPLVTDLSQYYEGLSDQSYDVYQYVRYGDSINPFVTRFQQYHDIVGGWQGAQAIPTTAYTDLAHRTGAVSIGILYQPFFADDNDGFLRQDPAGNFVVADKLVDLAGYFGFDGYFLNVEVSLSATQVDGLMAFITSMKARAAAQGQENFTVQWYDAVTVEGMLTYQNTLNSENAPWITKAGADSIFINYKWDQVLVQDGVEYAQSIDLDPFSVCLFGLQFEDRTGIGITPAPTQSANNEIELVIPTNGAGAPVAGIALFDPANGTVALATTSPPPNPSTPGLPDLQSTVYEAERLFWSGGTGNPHVPAQPGTSSYGIANYVAERSAIGSVPFFCRFNTGTGNAFYLNGTASSSTSWFSAGIQDILPTWQWWTEEFGTSPASPQLSAGYDYTTAFDGGSSLRVAGDLTANSATAVRLFKTDLKTTVSTQAEVLYRSKTPHAADLYLARLRLRPPSSVAGLA